DELRSMVVELVIVPAVFVGVPVKTVPGVLSPLVSKLVLDAVAPLLRTRKALPPRLVVVFGVPGWVAFSSTDLRETAVPEVIPEEMNRSPAAALTLAGLREFAVMLLFTLTC